MEEPQEYRLNFVVTDLNSQITQLSGCKIYRNENIWKELDNINVVQTLSLNVFLNVLKLKRKVKFAYKPSGPSGCSLSRFL